jgi:dTMP kinase
MAYQGKARRLGLETVLELHRHDPLNLLPHRTYFLDINLETSMERQKLRGQQKDYFESEETEFHLNLIDGYREMAQIFPERILTIDASKTPEDISKVIDIDLGKILK